MAKFEKRLLMGTSQPNLSHQVLRYADTNLDGVGP
jgi:hypothetical protein